MNQHTEEIKTNYKGSFETFNKNFTVTDAMLAEFLDFVKEKKVEFKEDQYTKDKDFIQSRLKAYIARNFWGNDGWYPIVLSIDNQLKKALSLFPEAEKIAHLN